MNKYARLLTAIAEEFRIRQGKNESEIDFKVRIIYSALSRLAYARLWDKSVINHLSFGDLSETVSRNKNFR